MRTRNGTPFGHPGCPITGKQSGPFVDTNKTIRVGNQRVPFLVSVAGAHLLGRHVGMLERDDRVELQAKVLQLESTVRRLEEELAEADAIENGITALSRKGFKVTKAPARPKKVTP